MVFLPEHQLLFRNKYIDIRCLKTPSIFCVWSQQCQFERSREQVESKSVPT